MSIAQLQVDLGVVLDEALDRIPEAQTIEDITAEMTLLVETIYSLMEEAWAGDA